MIIPDEVTRSNRRSVSITIMKNGSVVVKAPLKMAESEINKFVESKQDWIKNKLTIINSTLMKFQDIISYKKVLVYGNKYTILLANVKNIELDDNMQIIFPKKVLPEKRLKYLKQWYKKFAKKILESRIEFLAKQFKLQFTSFKITDSKGRWGSCNSRGQICINFRVVMLPPSIIDYILVHELCHLVEMNHSKRFWELVLNFYSQAKTARNALKQYSFLLDLYKN